MERVIKNPLNNGLSRFLNLHNFFVLGSFFLALLTYALLQKYTKAQNLNKIVSRGKSVEILLEKSFNQNLEVVYSIQNLFYTRKDFSRAQFKTFVSNSLTRHPGLQAVEHMLYIKGTDRAKYEKKMRAEGFLNFTIKQFATGGGVEVAENRPEYYVINYVEPLEDNLAALGYDVSYTPPALEALRSAQRNGVGVSPWMPLAQGETGFVVYMNIAGGDSFAVGVFRLKKFIEIALRSSQSEGIDFIVEEAVEVPSPLLAFQYDSQHGVLTALKKQTLNDEGLSSTSIIEVGQRKWKIVHFPSESYKSIIHPALPIIAGLTVLLLMMALTFFLSERDARVTAETATKVREEFMTVASHELRTPLTPLKMEIFLLRELVQSGQSGKEKLLSLLDNANKHLNHIVALIDDLLDVGRIGEEHYKYNFSHFEINDLIKEIADKFSPVFKANHSSILFNLQPNIRVYWDAQRIEQVIANCISNSVKFSARAIIEIELRTEGPYVVFSVKDNGIGISPEFQKRMFNKFERGVSSKSYGGLGLGLYIVDQIIKAHGGTVTVVSAPGKGAEFIFKVPSNV